MAIAQLQRDLNGSSVTFSFSLLVYYMFEYRKNVHSWPQAQIRQQGEFESIHRDMMIGIKAWEFDPMDLEDPFPNNEGSVHIWQGNEDGLVSVVLQRYVAERLPWVRYQELKGSGHMFPYADGMGDKIMKTFLLGETFVS